MNPTNHSSAGYILPIVLFLVIILTSGGMFALHIAKQEISNTASLFDTVEAQIEAESQIEIIKFYASSGHFTQNRIENNTLNKISSTYLQTPYPEVLYIDNREQNITSTLSLKLQDTAGLLNAMYPDANAISELLNNTKKFNHTDTLRDSVEDWFDLDDFHRINGAEENYYREQKFAYTPRNAHISQSREELRLIRGIADLSVDQWEYLSRFLVLSPVSAFNFATAPSELIAAKLHVSVKELDGLEELRRRDLVEFVKRIRVIGTGYNPETSGIFPSKIVAVQVTVRRNNAKVHATALLDCTDYDDAPLHVISWY